MLVVAKPVTGTLDPNRPRKTRSRYNDMLSCVRKPKGFVTMSQKIAVSFHCLLCDFRQKPHWGGGHFTPTAETRVNYCSAKLVINQLTTSERVASGRDLASASHEQASEAVAMVW